MSLSEAYPGCPNLMQVIQRMEGHPAYELVWVLERARGDTVQTVVERQRRVLSKPLALPVSKEALAETHHPDYTKYVIAKLGAM